MKIQHSLVKIQAKLARLEVKALAHTKWGDMCSYDMGVPEGVGSTSKGKRIERRISRIEEKYGII